MTTYGDGCTMKHPGKQFCPLRSGQREELQRFCWPESWSALPGFLNEVAHTTSPGRNWLRSAG